MHRARLAELREEAGFKPYDISAKLRVHPQTVSRWESGGTIPDSRKFDLANLFGVSIAYLMGWDDDRGKPPGKSRKAVPA